MVRPMLILALAGLILSYASTPLRAAQPLSHRATGGGASQLRLGEQSVAIPGIELAGTAPAAAMTADYTIFLPLIAGPPAPPPAVSEPGALFLNQTNRTNSAQIQVDSAGRIHVAYAAFNRAGDGTQPAYYAVCPARCADRASWAVVSLGDRVQEVQLALTPDGKPRMLFRAEDTNQDYYYQYAACDARCDTTIGWQSAIVRRVKLPDPFLWEYSQHYFALDPQGRPRFVYFDALNAPYNGTFYAFCDATCTSAASWRELKLSDEPLSDPSLAFTTTGQPRFVAVYSGGPTSVLAYLSCDTSCEQLVSWRARALAERGSGRAGFVLRLDGQSRPRIAFYQGMLADGQGQRLFYLWCDLACEQEGRWEGANVGLASQQGQEPDLAFDREDRPRIVYRQNEPQGLGYGWCARNCESPNAVWQHRLAEASSGIEEAWPIAPPQGCAVSYWYGGYRPALALDHAGNPRVAYDAEHAHGGGSCAEPRVDFKTVRVLLMQP